MADTVKCIRCRREKTVAEMRKAPRLKRGYYLYCADCDNKRRNQVRGHPRVSRKEIRRKLPPYPELKKLYCDQGLSYAEIAERYDVHRSAVYMTMRRRALAYGDPWPLQSWVPTREKMRRNIAKDAVAPDIIIGMVWEYLEPIAKQTGHRCAFCGWRLTADEKAVVGRPAPPSKRGWRTFWCDEGCMQLYFRRRELDPGTWKTKRVAVCNMPSPFNLALRRFCSRHGLSPNYLKDMRAGRYKTISREYARRLLIAIGEPAPPPAPARNAKYTGNQAHRKKAACPSSSAPTAMTRLSASTMRAPDAGSQFSEAS